MNGEVGKIETKASNGDILGIQKDFYDLLNEKFGFEYEFKIDDWQTTLENLKNKNGVYTLKTKNFDLKKRSYLAIIYQNNRRIIANHLKREYHTFPVLSISSSAENAKYLIDNDPKTVWKGKEGDWIKIQLPKVLTYFKDKER